MSDGNKDEHGLYARTENIVLAFLPSLLGIGIGKYFEGLLGVPQESRTLFWILVAVIAIVIPLGNAVALKAVASTAKGDATEEKMASIGRCGGMARSLAIGSAGIIALLAPLTATAAVLAASGKAQNAYILFLALYAAAVLGTCAAQFASSVSRMAGVLEEKWRQSTGKALSNVQQSLSSTTHASTATCIPMRFDKPSNRIHMVMICNPAYEIRRWMFPGGHTLPSANDINRDTEPPCDTAIGKMREEVGFDGRIVDLFGAHDAMNTTRRGNMDSFKQPHFTYVFTLGAEAKCSRLHGHRFHYDSVYVVEYAQQDEWDIVGEDASGRRGGPEQPYDAVVVELPVTELDDNGIRAKVSQALMEHARSLGLPEGSCEFGDFVVTMALDAHGAYRKYLRRTGQLRSSGRRRGR